MLLVRCRQNAAFSATAGQARLKALTRQQAMPAPSLVAPGLPCPCGARPGLAVRARGLRDGAPVGCQHRVTACRAPKPSAPSMRSGHPLAAPAPPAASGTQHVRHAPGWPRAPPEEPPAAPPAAPPAPPAPAAPPRRRRLTASAATPNCAPRLGAHHAAASARVAPAPPLPAKNAACRGA